MKLLSRFLRGVGCGDFLSLLCLLLAYCKASFQSTTDKDGNCIREYLLSLGNTTAGTTISLYFDAGDSLPDDDQQLGHQELLSILAKDLYLSPFCGIDLVRCREVFVRQNSINGTEQYIVFIPALNGVLLIELQHETGHMIEYVAHTLIETPVEYDCSPTAVLSIFHAIFTLCVNTETRSLELFEIELVSNSLKDTAFSLIPIDFPSVYFELPLSNFRHVSLGSDYGAQFIFFTVSDQLYGIQPFNQLYWSYASLKPCNSAHRLEYAGDSVLMAYCDDNRFVEYYDVYYEVAHNHTEVGSGLPFLCPNRDAHFSVYPGYIQFGIWSKNSLENFQIPGGLDFKYGLCFGSESEINDTYFAYIDGQAGVFVLNPITNRLVNLSIKACQNACQPLMMVCNRYLIFQERSRGSENVIVVDSQNGFSRAIEAWGARVDLFTVITDQCPREVPPGPGPTDSVHVHSGSSGLKAPEIAGISVAFVLVVAFIVCVVLGVAIKLKMIKFRCPSQPKQESTSLQVEYHGSTEENEKDKGILVFSKRNSDSPNQAPGSEKADTGPESVVVQKPTSTDNSEKAAQDSQPSAAPQLTVPAPTELEDVIVASEPSSASEPLSSASCDHSAPAFSESAQEEKSAASLNGGGGRLQGRTPTSGTPLERRQPKLETVEEEPNASDSATSQLSSASQPNEAPTEGAAQANSASLEAARDPQSTPSRRCSDSSQGSDGHGTDESSKLISPTLPVPPMMMLANLLKPVVDMFRIRRQRSESSMIKTKSA